MNLNIIIISLGLAYGLLDNQKVIDEVNGSLAYNDLSPTDDFLTLCRDDGKKIECKEYLNLMKQIDQIKTEYHIKINFTDVSDLNKHARFLMSVIKKLSSDKLPHGIKALGNYQYGLFEYKPATNVLSTMRPYIRPKHDFLSEFLSKATGKFGFNIDNIKYDGVSKAYNLMVFEVTNDS